jgi:cell division protein FtsB
MSDFSMPPSGPEQNEASAPQKKRKLARAIIALPRWLISRFGLMAVGGVVICGLIYLASQGEGFVKQTELEEERIRLEAEIETLRDENRLLRERLERLKNDPAFVEDEARKKLGLIRSGETVYRLSEEPELKDDFQDPALP